MNSYSPRLIAFHLPQFHPIPENDAWWGKGFTEWSNVAKAKPLFRGHYQPHLPADLGFYDLRLPEAREQQSALAREYGIYGFCYYHYWFSGRRLLERPVDEIVASGRPDFPFCLCWANENWTRTWDGRDRQMLLKQEYSLQADRRHISDLRKYFEDPRYIRINNRPMFLVYRASSLPNPKQTVEVWREEAARLGLGELYLCRVESSAEDHGRAAKDGFDAAVEFAPDWTRNPPAIGRSILNRALGKVGLWRTATLNHNVRSYEQLMRNMLAKPRPDCTRFRCVTPSFDNSSRRQTDATIFVGSTPELYQFWLEKVLQTAEFPSEEENFVFINAWNEWAEGNHLEPCGRWGRGYLEATRSARSRAAKSQESRVAVSA